ncbi:MAG: hypothetical protein QOE98_2571 [Gaiellaceae bacterium]|nr:hypothetical protein [Gaiellaceae bacterium]
MEMFKSKAEKQASADAEVAYLQMFAALETNGLRLLDVPTKLDELAAAGYRSFLSERGVERIREGIVRQAIDAVLADDRLNGAEEAALLDALQRFGVTLDNMDQTAPGVRNRLLVAKVNDGRLPVVDEPLLIARPGERVHLEYEAQLMKIDSARGYQDRSRDAGFRIVEGAPYRVGRNRGRTINLGTAVSVDDVGTLSITDRRVVFTGSIQTLEFRYDKLAGIALFSQGIRISVTNQRKAGLFQLDHVDVVAAVLNAAAQRIGSNRLEFEVRTPGKRHAVVPSEGGWDVTDLPVSRASWNDGRRADDAPALDIVVAEGGRGFDDAAAEREAVEGSREPERHPFPFPPAG